MNKNKCTVISVINQKGGVGKSTTAEAMGAGLRKEGYKVLFIDLDPQGNLSYSIDADVSKYNAMGVLQRPETAMEEIQHKSEGDIIASTPALTAAETALKTGKERRLKLALEPLKDIYDYVIIDTPPALSVLTVNALTASDEAVIPAQADIYSLQGINQLYENIEDVKKYCNENLKIKGMFLTRYNKRAMLSRDVRNIMEKTARQMGTKLYKTAIRECVAIKEAQLLKQNIFDYAPNSNAAQDYAELLKEMFKDEK